MTEQDGIVRDQLLDDLTELLKGLRADPPGGRPLRVLIDGPSGSGKTTLAADLASQLDAVVIHMDDLYPGWTGLAAGSRTAEHLLTMPHPGYHPWLWEEERRGPWVALDPARHWVIEGSGALTRDSSRTADYSVWLDADPQKAMQRALARDGDTFRPHSAAWHAQEKRHWERNEPSTLATRVLAVGMGDSWGPSVAAETGG